MGAVPTPAHREMRWERCQAPFRDEKRARHRARLLSKRRWAGWASAARRRTRHAPVSARGPRARKRDAVRCRWWRPRPPDRCRSPRRCRCRGRCRPTRWKPVANGGRFVMRSDSHAGRRRWRTGRDPLGPDASLSVTTRRVAKPSWGVALPHRERPRQAGRRSLHGGRSICLSSDSRPGCRRRRAGGAVTRQAGSLSLHSGRSVIV